MSETASCCKAFCLSSPYADIMASYDAWLAREKTFTTVGGEESPVIGDVPLVAPMIRPIGVFQEHPSTGTLFDEPVMLYRCVHLADDGLCGIYQRRPDLCRHYPSDYCGFHKCSRWSGAQCGEPA